MAYDPLTTIKHPNAYDPVESYPALPPGDEALKAQILKKNREKYYMDSIVNPLAVPPTSLEIPDAALKPSLEIPEGTKRNHEKYYQDTIAPTLVKSNELVPAAIASTAIPNYNVSGVRPRLEAPEISSKEIKTAFSDSNNYLIQEINKNENEADKNNQDIMTEYEMLANVFKSYYKQKTLTEDQSSILFDIVKKRQELSKKMGKDYFKHFDEILEKASISDVLSWINWGFVGASAFFFLLSLILSFGATAALLPIFLTLGGLSTFTSGALELSNGVLKHVTDKLRGEIKELEHLRSINEDKIKSSMDEMQHDLEVIHTIMQQMIEILENWNQAAKMN